MAVRGDDAHKIMQRCGHQSFTTTMLYVRDGGIFYVHLCDGCDVGGVS
jgi:hypothetical protein